MPTRRAPSSDPKVQSRQVARALSGLYPRPECALRHRNAFELLVATILSAQCTDARVNLVTPALFARFPDPRSLASAESEEVERLIHPTGFFRAKTKNLVAMAKRLVEHHAGVVPADLEALTHLPGVGRKTANVVLGTAFGVASGVVVDTHVKRLARRLGLSREADPAKIERDLMAQVPKTQWVELSHRLILHGRAVCTARSPRCEACTLSILCPKIGVKPGSHV